jgi:hypothetical protein
MPNILYGVHAELLELDTRIDGISAGVSTARRVEFAVPSLTWVIPYDSATPPNVMTTDLSGDMIDGLVTYDESSQEITIAWGGEQAGRAYLTTL